MKIILISLLVIVTIVTIACNKKKEDNPQPNTTVPKVEEPKKLDSTDYQKLYIDNKLVSTWLEGRGTDTQYNPFITLYTQGTTIDYIRAGYHLNNIDYYFDKNNMTKNYKIVGSHILGDEMYYDVQGYVQGIINNQNVRLEFKLPY